MYIKGKQEGNCLPQAQIMTITRDLLMAILQLHSYNPSIAHRGIQLKNVLCATNGTYKLSNFGNASTIHGTPKGSTARAIATEDIRENSTLAYRAPEQVDLRKACVLNEKVDIWAAGVLLYTLFFLGTPFEGKSEEAISSSILKGFNPGKATKAPKGKPISRGAIEIMGYCMTLNPVKRPSAGMVFKRCEALSAGQNLPCWPGLDTDGQPTHHLPHSPPMVGSSITPPPKLPRPLERSVSKKSLKKEASSTSLANSNNSSFSQNIGDTKRWEGVQSKWYKLIGGEQTKRLWILKTTSRCLCGPKPKYIRLIVRALWDNTLSLDGFFQLLRYRPLAESPIIAVKALTTILKVLRQGPPHCLTDCSTYVDVIDEIGQMWTTTLGNSHRPYGYEDEKLDGPLVLLIGKLASMLVKKVRFHQHLPEYHELFTTIPAKDAKEHIPGMEEEGLESVAGVVGRLLSLQEHVLTTINSAMMVVNGNPSTGIESEGSLPTVSMLPPLAEECYVTWVATARLMSTMAKVSETMSASCMDWYSALKLQYEDQVHDIKRLLRRLGSIHEVRAPQTHETVKSGEYTVKQGIGDIELYDSISLDNSTHWPRPAQSKAEVVASLKREADLVEQQPMNESKTNQGFNVKIEDDDYVSDNEEEFEELKHDYTPSWPELSSLDSKLGTNGDINPVSSVRGDLGTLPMARSSNANTVSCVPDQNLRGNSVLRTGSGGKIAAALPATLGINGGLQERNTCPPFLTPRVELDNPMPKHSADTPLQYVKHSADKTPPQFVHHNNYSWSSSAPHSMRGVHHHEYVHSRLATSDGLQDIHSRKNNEGMDEICSNVQKGVVELNILEPSTPSSYHQDHTDAEAAIVQSTGMSQKHGHQELLSVEPRKKRIAIANYSYDAQGAEQLSFNVGDIITLHSDKVNGKGWGLGEMDRKMGWFPGDYVSFLNDTVSVDDDGKITLQDKEQVSVESESSLLDPNMLPEHKFAIQMARAEPWKDSLSAGGQRAYAELVNFFRSTQKVIHFHSLNLKEVLGSGAFAIVFHATHMNRSVAVKKLVGGGGGPMERNLRDFQTEAALLSHLCHPNIITAVGATIEPVTFIMEYCSRGNLMDVLMNSNIPLNWERKKKILQDVASGMQYLHHQDPVIIHRDLKSLNILLDENWVAKVSDFGLSRFKAPTKSEKMTGQAGTYHWMAPEVINSQNYDQKVDVYSFGVIMWEVSFRSIPYDGMQPVQIVAAVVGRRERPRIPPGAPKRASDLIKECWLHNPSLRPSFDKILDQLAEFRLFAPTF